MSLPAHFDQDDTKSNTTMDTRRSSTASGKIIEKTTTGDTAASQPTPAALEAALKEVASRRRDDSSAGLLNEAEEPNWPQGWRPWLCLVACFFLMFNSWGLVNAYGTFGSYYLQHLFVPTTAVKVNLIGALDCAIVLGLSGIVGRLLDAGFIRYCLGTGTVFVAAGMFMLGPINAGSGPGHGDYGLTVLAQGVITALGMSCFFVASSQIVATWFKKRKSVAVGLVACGASIAGLVYPVTTKFILQVGGFETAALADAGICLATCIFAFIFARPNPKHVFNKPQSWLAKETWIDPHAFQNPAFWFFTAAIAFMFFGFYAIFFNVEEWAAYRGYGRKDTIPGGFRQVTTHSHHEVHDDAIRTFYLLAIMNVSSSVGRIGGGVLGERFGSVFIHSVVTFVAAILCGILWPLVPDVAGAIAFVILFGMFSGAVIGMPPASMMFILERDPKANKNRVGQWVGSMYTFAAIWALTGPLIAGALIQETGAYLGMQLWSAICLLLAAVCMGIANLMALRDEKKSFAKTVRESFSSFTSRRQSPQISTTNVSSIAP